MDALSQKKLAEAKEHISDAEKRLLLLSHKFVSSHFI